MLWGPAPCLPRARTKGNSVFWRSEAKQGHSKSQAPTNKFRGDLVDRKPKKNNKFPRWSNFQSKSCHPKPSCLEPSATMRSIKDFVVLLFCFLIFRSLGGNLCHDISKLSTDRGAHQYKRKRQCARQSADRTKLTTNRLCCPNSAVRTESAFATVAPIGTGKQTGKARRPKCRTEPPKPSLISSDLQLPLEIEVVVRTVTLRYILRT